LNLKVSLIDNLLTEGEKASPLKKTKQGISFCTKLTAVRNLAAPALGSMLEDSMLYTSLK